MKQGEKNVTDESMKTGDNGAEPKGERIAGLDLVRTVAAFFVVCVHFYLNCGYYSAPLEGTAMFFATYGRWLFLTCVPLFIMMTGYFKLNKKFGAAHYKSLIPILVAYVIISVIKIIASNYLYGTVYYFSDAVRNILNYQMAWYVGMYISLMLLVPFLNIMWHALDLKMKRILIASLLFISTLYPLVKFVAPSYWQMLYPFVYYFIGAYIRENQPKIKKWIAVLILAVILILETIGVFRYTNGAAFKWDFLGAIDNGYNAFPVVVCTVIVFMCLYDVKIKSKVLCFIFRKISSVSLEIYLFAGIFDAYIYYYAKRYILEGAAFMPYFLPLVLMSFFGALIASLLYKAVYDFFYTRITGHHNAQKIYKTKKS